MGFGYGFKETENSLARTEITSGKKPPVIYVGAYLSRPYSMVYGYSWPGIIGVSIQQEVKLSYGKTSIRKLRIINRYIVDSYERERIWSVYGFSLTSISRTPCLTRYVSASITPLEISFMYIGLPYPRIQTARPHYGDKRG